MESRDIKDLDIELATAFNKAVTKWRELYPLLSVPFLTCTHRPNADQTKLYAIGRTVKGKKVTYAKAGESPHNYLPAMAFDIAFKASNGTIDWSEHLFEKFAFLMEKVSIQIVWGGDWQTFKDLPHFELKNWKILVKG